MRLFVLSLLLSLCFITLGQTTNGIDSLYNKLASSSEDTSKIDLYLEIGKYYQNSIPDSAASYFKKGLELSQDINATQRMGIALNKLGTINFFKADYDSAVYYYNRAIKIFELLENKKQIAKSTKNIGVVYSLKSDYNKSLDYFQKSLELYKEIHDSVGIAKNLVNIGANYNALSVHDKAIECFQQSLDVFKDIDSKYGIALSLGNIGITLLAQKEYDEALNYYKQALKESQKIDNQRLQANYIEAVGTVYSLQKKYEEAVSKFKEAYDIYSKLQDKAGIAVTMQDIGDIYQQKKEYDKALNFLEKALDIYIEIGNQEGEASVLLSLSKQHEKLGNYKQALQFALKSVKIAKKIESLEIQKDSYGTLSNILRKTGDYKTALQYQDSSIVINEKIYNKGKTKAIAQMQIRYESEKKEKQLLEQQKELAISQLEIKQQKNLRNFLIIGFLLTVVFVLIIYRSLIQNRRANKILADQKAEIEIINEELASTVETVNQHKKIIKESFDSLQASVNYAGRIQNGLLPDKKLFTKYFSSHFILHKPKDVVSGDFYYLKEVDGHIIIAVADCTGHGIPGAFVSVLGISLLNEVIRRKEIRNTAGVLEELRIQLKQSLNQSDERVIQDGMDIAFCAINEDTKMLEYSGANSPIFVVKNKQLETVKATRNPIGIYPNEKPFQYHHIQLEKGDRIYLFTDGFSDQLGGKNAKTFRIRHFRNLIINIQDKSLAEQNLILENTLKEWMGEQDQTDDITVIGIEI